MKNIIVALYEILSMHKGFEAGFSSPSLGVSKMLVEYENKRYVLEVREIQHPSKDIADDIKRVHYL